MRTQPQVIFILGPTCSGKTEIAIRLSEHLPCEIISVDSALIYRGMDIGTAKPSAELRSRVPHHLIDILDPSERYSAAKFLAAATNLAYDIHHRGKIPIFVGGTMFYFNVFEYGIDAIPDVDQAVRDEVEASANARGIEFLYSELKRNDPASASQIHPNDSQRIKRAVEVYRAGLGAISDFHCGRKRDRFSWQSRRQPRRQPRRRSQWQILKIALNFSDRALLHRRIENRLDDMLKQGLVRETARLMLRQDLGAELPSMRVVGYSQAWAYLAGKLGFEEMRNQAIYATRQLAKRQLTWMRSMTDLKLFYMDNEDVEGLNQNLYRSVLEAVPSARL